MQADVNVPVRAGYPYDKNMYKYVKVDSQPKEIVNLFLKFTTSFKEGKQGPVKIAHNNWILSMRISKKLVAIQMTRHARAERGGRKLQKTVANIFMEYMPSVCLPFRKDVRISSEILHMHTVMI